MLATLWGLTSAMGSCRQPRARHPLPAASSCPAQPQQGELINTPARCGEGWPNLQDREGADTAPRTRDARQIALCFCLCFFLLTQIAAIINKPKGRSETPGSSPSPPVPRHQAKLLQTHLLAFAGREAAGEQRVCRSVARTS